MSEPNRFPVIVSPPDPEAKASELTRAVGKTVASVEFGKEQGQVGGQSEAIVIYFSDGSSVAVTAGPNALELARSADGAAIDLTVVWKDDSEWKAFDEVMGM